MELLDIEPLQAPTTTALAPIERAALALESSKTEAHLLALATKHASIVQVKDKAGREQAHGAAMELTRARTTVEKAAKEAREDATKFSKAVIAEADRLVAIVAPEETRLKAVRDAWDTEQARIKAEAEAKERARVLAITERIAAIKSYVMLANNCRTSERVSDLKVRLAGVALVDFEEFTDEAMAAKAYATEHLARVHADRKADEEEAARIKAEQEAEAARLDAERKELARQRAEAEKAARVAAQAAADERARLEAELAAQRVAAHEEAKRIADEARAQAEAAEAKAKAAAEAMAAERAELERMRAELEGKTMPPSIFGLGCAAPVFTASSEFGVLADGEELCAKSNPAEQPICVASASTMAAEVSALAEPTPGVPLLVGELGVVDAGITIVETPRAPVASAICLAVAEFWHTDNKTAARWITERAAEIATLKG